MQLLLYIAHHGRLGCADIMKVQKFLYERKGQGDIDIAVLAGDIDRGEVDLLSAVARGRVVQALLARTIVLSDTPNDPSQQYEKNLQRSQSALCGSYYRNARSHLRLASSLVCGLPLRAAVLMLTSADDLKLGEQEAECLRGQSTMELRCLTSTRLKLILPVNQACLNNVPQLQWHPFPVPSLLLPNVDSGKLIFKRGEFELGCGDCRTVPPVAGMFLSQLYTVKQLIVENVDLSEIEVPWLRFMTGLDSLALIGCRITSLRDGFPTRLRYV